MAQLDILEYYNVSSELEERAGKTESLILAKKVNRESKRSKVY